MAAKRGAEEKITKEVMVVQEMGGGAVAVVEEQEEKDKEKEEAHPYAFHVSGPRNVARPNWRDLINSSWSTENRTYENALAPKWWMTFKYKLTDTLIDERDESIFGAVLEWDQSAALADFVLIRPSGAPKAVLVLRGTLLKGPTIRRDIEDDLRFLAWESLKGSVRFRGAFEALKAVAERYGSSNVCIAGHSLGAGFALQVGKALAKEGIYVDAHLFNPPSISLAMSLRNIGEKAGSAWKRLKSMLPSSSEPQASSDEGIEDNPLGLKNWLGHIYGDKASVGLKQWVPHLYVNNSDYICCYYTDPDGTVGNDADKENVGPSNGQVGAKLFVMSKGKQSFLRLTDWSSGGQMTWISSLL
ncbi:golgi transport complex family protein [Hibiscus syriacus]|uniref:Golgi transport complex family protein n=1 Tax=Hibiscus syriacus TaxID=106335 RepID=A0A6A2Z0P6_HIBSY|nr:golgi transport complex family protein [Hibiscus syriacus]